MKTANVADLRNNFKRVASWIADGESVAINKRGKLFATLVPSNAARHAPMPQVDFAAQLRDIWGSKIFSAKEIAAMKEAEHEGEEG